MNRLKRKILKAISDIAGKEGQIFTGSNKTPCIGYFYQPKRPKKN